ncbi:hypothetical protein C1H46_004583 [Malus baccata]|uniref:Uncharacterized protein n=1 Tax=Malus baccata TaxID=106549 RepID=A0A540NFL2_MALBA|nr:hypothetical protein C1H46_004583 [Malus baccata]
MVTDGQVVEAEQSMMIDAWASFYCAKRGMDGNAVGSCAERFFAPIDASFADDTPLLPSGFHIIPLDYGKQPPLQTCRAQFFCNLPLLLTETAAGVLPSHQPLRLFLFFPQQQIHHHLTLILNVLTNPVLSRLAPPSENAIVKPLPHHHADVAIPCPPNPDFDPHPCCLVCLTKPPPERAAQPEPSRTHCLFFMKPTPENHKLRSSSSSPCTLPQSRTHTTPPDHLINDRQTT